MKQTVRIIGGLYRGKKIHFPELEGLRPTPDRVKETLFNWLMNDIKNARCLDAFAGSGALGIEAFSRGAAKVTFIEQSPLAFANLKKSLQQFNHPSLNLIQTNAIEYLKKGSETFDIIFLDPPYSLNYLPSCLDLIVQSQILASGGLVFAESSSPFDINPEHWKQLKLKQAGQVIFGLFEKV
ncbi:16S rRNA (guanine(966)-N(2))-methyltransferase RsmD [Legionella waltersii]|uniref:Ribosomal RNA small subunit methyltransferase D n=1 Tax=Legionella waltersii TaxID=66969 RepID=A0A0W1AD51_9GAMM|nr:16S rRNA (guanine(966)-N(2))-methyltransferase RsmD [Legionella waltersii]KTD79276.1 putative methylase [Legionella waltersii]SNV12839.1 putative methylase [Legionella waltersii]